MNKLKTTDVGGFPLRLDDFRWIDDAQRETFLGVIRTVIGAEQNCILYGCLVVDTEQGDVWTCTEGFVFFNDEIYYVPAHNVVHPDGYLVFAEDITYQTPDGLKTFEDANAFETYEVRRAKLVSSLEVVPNSMPYNSSDYITVLKNRLGIVALVETGHTEVTLDSSNVVVNSGAITNISGKMSYKLRGKTAFVSIDLSLTVSVATPSLYIILPVALRIKKTTTFETNLIHNITSGVERTDFVYRLMAWDGEDRVAIAHLVLGSDLEGNAYHLNGQIFFETP